MREEVGLECCSNTRQEGRVNTSSATPSPARQQQGPPIEEHDIIRLISADRLATSFEYEGILGIYEPGTPWFPPMFHSLRATPIGTFRFSGILEILDGCDLREGTERPFLWPKPSQGFTTQSGRELSSGQHRELTGADSRAADLADDAGRHRHAGGCGAASHAELTAPARIQMKTPEIIAGDFLGDGLNFCRLWIFDPQAVRGLVGRALYG